jgi:photosystem II stability/assembly factor-like uncharacterized protein
MTLKKYTSPLLVQASGMELLLSINPNLTNILVLMNISRRLLSLALPVAVLITCCNRLSIKTDPSGQTPNINGRNDQWGFIGPGGGGAMFNPAINPSDPDHVFVACDMTGSYVTYDGGKKWRMFNLKGVSRFFVFDPEDGDLVYAGTSTRLFRSGDRGNTWHTLYPDPEDILTIHTRGDHASEVVVTRDSTITRIKKLSIDPDNSQDLYLLVEMNDEREWSYKQTIPAKSSQVLLVSNDAGENWKEESIFEFDADNVFIDATSPYQNRTLYVTGKENIRARKDGDWSKVDLPEQAGSINQYVHGVDTKTGQHIIYAISGKSYFNPQGKMASGIYKTIDGGENWDRQEKGLVGYKARGAADPEFRSIAISQYHPETIYLSYAGLIFGKDSVGFGVAKSSDYGDTWQLVWNDMYANGQGIVSPNRESGWLDERFGPGWGENPFHMGVADHDPDICFATDFGRTIKTANGGNTWQQVYTNKLEGGGWISRGLQVTTGYMLAFDPFDPLHVFMADTDTGLMESFDGGKSWTSATFKNGVPRQWVNSTYWLLFDPEKKGKVWALMSRNHDLPRPKMWRHMNMSDYRGGVLVSNTGGKTWQVTSGDMGESAATHIIMDPESDLEKRILYVCAFGKGVYKSEDGGISWQQKNKGIEEPQPAAWRITRRDDGELFLVVFRKRDDGSIGNEGDGALYRSSDGAESWVKMNMPEGVNGPTSLIVDLDKPDHILLSAWGRYGADRFSCDIGGGIFLSEDDGATWSPVLTHDQHIHDLTVDPESGTLYASGFNSSAYRSVDKGRTWLRIRGYNFKWGKRVQPDPADPDKIYIITFGGGVWHGPAKGDENALEDIVPLSFRDQTDH